MLRKLSKIVVRKISQDNNTEDIATLEYGCELMLYTAISTISLLLIGFSLGFGIESIIIISIFYLCQSNGGGFHASSHLKCFFTMVIGLLIAGLAIRCRLLILIIPVCGFVSTIILLAVPLVLHHNKEYLIIYAKLLSLKSRLVTLAISMTVIVLYYTDHSSLALAGCCSLFLSALSRIFSKTYH